MISGSVRLSCSQNGCHEFWVKHRWGLETDTCSPQQHIKHESCSCSESHRVLFVQRHVAHLAADGVLVLDGQRRASRKHFDFLRVQTDTRIKDKRLKAGTKKRLKCKLGSSRQTQRRETEAASVVCSPFYWNLGARTQLANRNAARGGSLNWRCDGANRAASRAHVLPGQLREIQTALFVRGYKTVRNRCYKTAENERLRNVRDCDEQKTFISHKEQTKWDPNKL